jgi:protein TonB
MEAFLVHRVQPEYPPLARAVRVQGVVVLQAIIARDGTVANLRVLSGHPMLVRAAVAAVQQWRYRPYLLNGEAVEVETQITVNFVLSGG